MSTPEERPDPVARVLVGEFERRLVRWALYALPILIAIGFVVAGRYWRSLLFLQPPTDWSTLWNRPAAFAGGLFAAGGILIGWISTRMTTDQPRRGINFAVVIATIGLVCMLDTLVDLPKARFTLEEAVKARAPQLDFVRNIAFKQQSLREPRLHTVIGDRRIVIIGSSQINLGIDTVRLQEMTSANGVIEVCMPGMVPLQYLVLADQLVAQHPTHVVCWVSEFDFFRESTLPTVRLRWSIDRQNFWKLASTLSARQKFRRRAELADLAFASVSTLWQQRSLFQMLAFRFWWRWDAEGTAVSADEAQVGGKLVGKEEGLLNVRRNIQRTSLVDSNFDAFGKFAESIVRSDGRLIVIEGESHPDTMLTYPPEFRLETRRRLRQLADTIGFEYWSENDRPSFKIDQWRDAVHLNQSGRERLTLFVSDLILLSTPDDSQTRHPN